MKSTKRILMCIAILFGVFVVAAFIGGGIAEAISNKNYAPGDKDRKYDTIGNEVTALLVGLISMLTIGVGLIIWFVKRWKKLG